MIVMININIERKGIFLDNNAGLKYNNSNNLERVV